MCIIGVHPGWANSVMMALTGVAWYLTDKLDQDWVFDDEHYQVEIVGDLGVKCQLHFVSSDYWGPEEP